MPIEFNCTQCGSVLRTPDNTAGKQAKCPQCGTVMTVPSASEQAGIPLAPLPDIPPLSRESAADRNPFGPPMTPVAPPRYAQSDNPYQSPAEQMYPTDQPRLEGTALVPQQFDLGDAIRRGWEIFKAHTNTSILAAVIIVAMEIGFQLFQQIVGMVLGIAAPPRSAVFLTQIVSVFVGLVFRSWATSGQALFFLRVVRGGAPSLPDLFRGGPFMLRYIAAVLIWSVVFLGIAAIALTPALIVWLATRRGELAAIAVAIPAIVVIPCFVFISVMFSQFYYLIVDRHLGAWESLTVSRQITLGNRLMVFAMVLLTGILNIAGCITCLGWLVSMPVTGYVQAVAYLTMTGQHIWMREPPRPPMAQPPIAPSPFGPPAQ